MAAKDWRPFASDFAGPGEIRFDDFESRPGAPGEAKGYSRGWDGQLVMDESVRQEKFQAMKRKLKEQQQRQKKADERRRQRDLVMAEAWKKHDEEIQTQKSLELKNRLRALEQAQQRVKEKQFQRQVAKEEKEEKAETDALTLFLTGVTLGEEQGEAKKPEEKKPKSPRKAGLPPEAKGSRSPSKQEIGVNDKQRDKTSVVQQLPQLFPGLRRTAEGKQILENADATQAHEKRPVTKEHLLRRTQIKLMDQLAAQISEFRIHARAKKSAINHPIAINDSAIEMAPSEMS